MKPCLEKCINAKFKETFQKKLLVYFQNLAQKEGTPIDRAALCDAKSRYFWQMLDVKWRFKSYIHNIH